MTTTPTPVLPAASPARRTGFTLIELMITVAIVAILAAIALPAYFEQVARGRRADVQTVLVDQANYMQRYYSAHNSFKDTAAPPSLPASQAPLTGVANYLITVTTGNPPTSYLLTATRTGPMTGDKCGNFTYDNLGVKGLQAGSMASGQTTASCWR